MIRKLTFLFILLAIANITIGQTSKNIIVNELLRVFTTSKLDQAPLFADCHLAQSNLDSMSICSDQNLNAYIKYYRRTPELAKKYDITKTIYVDAIVIKNGLLVNLMVDGWYLEEMSALQKEAVRIVNSMNEPKPLWSPALIDGKPVNSHLRIPITFGSDYAH